MSTEHTSIVENDFLNDVVSGLSGNAKSLPCKYFYDQRGSKLFDQICELDEYYLTRIERSILQENIQSIAYQIGRGVMLVEYGSGSSTKTRVLLDALEEPVAYVPVDISEEHLLSTAADLTAAYPAIEILPVVADFTNRFELPKSKTEPSHVALYFPGSTIGNFTQNEAAELLDFMSQMLGPMGGLLIGIDLQKDPAVIEAAYNDVKGVTARFNLNLLDRINKELDGDFDLTGFQHQSVYDDSMHRIETNIVSLREQSVQVVDQAFDFSEGESIHTEYSHKYTVDGFAEFASQFGFSLHKHWTDAKDYFAILHLVRD